MADLSKREEDARTNLKAALKRANVDFTAEVTRQGDGYTITFRRGGQKIVDRGLDESILEDDPSPQLDALVERASSRFSQS